MVYSNILFDLDGTLTDPKVGITKSVQYALNKFGIKAELENLVSFIGPPLQGSFKEYYGLNEENSKKAVEYYREYFSLYGIYENEVYSEIEDLLQELRNRGATLIVATSKPTKFAKLILEHFKLDQYFDVIKGSNLDGSLSDKTELISYIISEQKMDTKKSIMIGDRKHDIIGAINCGIDSIGVGYGYGTEDELTKAGSTAYVKTVVDLRNLLIEKVGENY